MKLYIIIMLCCGIVIITLSSIAIIKESIDIKNMITKKEDSYNVIRQKLYAYDKGYKEGFNKGYDDGYVAAVCDIKEEEND